MIVVRLSIALLFATLFTGAVFWALWRLVTVTVDVGELRQATRIEFTRMRRDSETQTRREEKIERQRPPVAPAVPRMSVSVASRVESNVQMLAPALDPRGAMQEIKLGAAGADRDVTPLVRINPEYPPRALRRSIEGWVIVQFTITAAGTVRDPKVVDADPKGIFDEAALKAIARWRYNPKVQDGVAVERVGIQTLIRFALED